jgi:2-polyprenyl-3-methyl-5-hydroxy-6-metoxy-1,4-benzoquinol methylase
MVRAHNHGLNDLAADIALELAGPIEGVPVLDVGAGEGTIARRMAGAGALVTATEPTAELLELARKEEDVRPLGIHYLPDRVETMPSVETDSVRVALAVLVLNHVEALKVALGELRRVLVPEGSLVVVVPHPWSDHPGCRPVEGVGGRPTRAVGRYQQEGFYQTDEFDPVRSIGWWHRTVATWLTTLAGAGFSPTDLREPVAAPSPRLSAWQQVPRFLAVRSGAVPSIP